MSKAIILMTALVPTIGHEALIKFANIIADDTHVIVSGRTKEPVHIWDRVESIRNSFLFLDVHEHWDDEAPQFPDPEKVFDGPFWKYWADVVTSKVGTIFADDMIVASEEYGATMAEVLGCKYVPFDTERTLYRVTGTDVRQNMYWEWENILPDFRKRIRQTVTFFGAESCGKTTMTEYMSDYYGAPMVTEWARTYLEAVGKELNLEKMARIVEGQYALQTVAADDPSTFFLFQDTDLLSTLGYYRIMGWEPDEYIYTDIEETKSNLYIVMNDGIPFETDPLRYGGDVRQSNTQFWINILEEFDCNYYVVKSTDLQEQKAEIFEQLYNLSEKIIEPIRNFEREKVDD